jgi:integrase
MAYLDVREVRGGKSYRIKYRINGKEKVTTFGDLAEAEHWLAIFTSAGPVRALQLLARELQGASALPTVREITERHITDLTGITDGTRTEYRREAERDIYPILGDLPITALEQALPGWINAMATRLSGKTIANRHGLLSAAAGSAVAAGHLTTNPCKGRRLPRGIQQEMVCLLPAEFRAIRAELVEFWRPLPTVLVQTGLRWGEATALQVGDVDLERRELHVRRAWKHRRREIGTPKTRAGAPIPANSFHGSHWGPAVARAYEAGAIREKPRPHDLRHTYASWLLDRGVPVSVVQRLLGHESITTTVNVYGHLMPDARATAATAAAAALSD